MGNYMWVCPFCKEENLDYWPIELEWDQCYFPWECCECGAKWEEWYSMDFIWHENLERGNKTVSEEDEDEEEYE